MKAGTGRRVALAAALLWAGAVVLEVLRGLAIEQGWPDEEDGRA